MPDLDPQIDADVTARLVEQLTKANERLDRLEAALRERSLLSSLRHQPEFADSHSPAANGAKGVTQGRAASKPEDTPHDPVREAEAHFHRGVALCQAGKYDEAVAAWQEVLRLQPDNVFAISNIGIVYTEQERWREARELFVRVLAIQRDNAEAYYGLGMADAQLGNYAGAIAAWENTLRLQPDNTDARYNLALVKDRAARQAVVAPVALPVTEIAPPSPSAPPPVAAMPVAETATLEGAPSAATASVAEAVPPSAAGASSVAATPINETVMPGEAPPAVDPPTLIDIALETLPAVGGHARSRAQSVMAPSPVAPIVAVEKEPARPSTPQPMASRIGGKGPSSVARSPLAFVAAIGLLLVIAIVLYNVFGGRTQQQLTSPPTGSPSSSPTKPQP